MQVGRRGAGAARLLLSGLEQRAELGVAVAGSPDRVAVYPERDVVDKRATVHVAEIDRPFQRGTEGVERAEEIVRRDADIAGEVVARTGRDADERDPAGSHSRCHDCQRSITPRNAESVGATSRDSLDEEIRDAALRR